MGLFTAFGLAALLILSERGVTTEANPNCTAPSPPQDVTAMAVSFSCVDVTWKTPSGVGNDITGYNITWNDTEGSSNTVDANTTSYQVTGLTPATTYTFTVYAENGCNTSQGETHTATTEEVPAVTNVTAWPVSNSTITVNWAYSEPECESVNRFELTYSRDKSQMNLNVSDVTMRSTNITDLDNKQGTYTISMTAVYQSTASPASDPVMVEFKAPTPPGGVSAMATSGLSITVTWTPPTLPSNRPPVTGYTVTAVPSSGSTLKTTSSTTSTVLSGLQEDTMYTIKVVAMNVVGNSLPRESTIDFSVPPPPYGVSAMATSGLSITVTWTPPTLPDNRPPITGYTVTAVPSSGSTVQTTSSTTSTVLSGLQEDTMYTIKVVAMNVVGNSSPATASRQTFGRPSQPQHLTIAVLSNSSLTAEWVEPADDGGDALINYTITLQGGPGATTRTVSSLRTTFTGLEAPNTYTVTVAAENRAGTSPPVEEIISFQAPPPPGGVTAMATFGSSITVTWTPPTLPDNRPPVTGYTVTAVPSSGSTPEQLPATATSTVLSELQRGTVYTIKVVAYSVVGNSLSENYTIDFSVSARPVNVKVTPVSGSELNVSWSAPDQPSNAPPVLYYTVSWKEEGGEGGSHNISGPANTMYQITGLAQGTQYNVTVTAHNSVGESDAATGSGTTFSVVPPNSPATNIGPGVGAAVGVTLAVVCLAAVLGLALYLIMKRRSRRRLQSSHRKGPRHMKAWDSAAQFTDTIRMAIHAEERVNLSGSQQDLMSGQEDSPVSTPILGRRNTKPSHPVSRDAFIGYVEGAAREELIAQYRSIPTKTHDLTALALINPLSNRYINILPYDKNRVVLSEPNSDGNDYINASYIDGYDKEHAFIAAQGPLQRTVDDFWQMVWDQKASVIVMLTKCKEGTKSKCAEYFPQNVNGRVFAKMDIAVVTKSIRVYKDYEVRILEVQNSKVGVTRTIHHFCYLGWPDFGVPESPTGVLTMLHHVRALTGSGDPDAPTITHCSAGVGRTGTFIALDHLVHQVQTEGEDALVDIPALVSTLRTQRGTMVQASEQYVFIHRALREYLLLGYTMLPGSELKSKVEEMSPVKRHSGVSRFQEQYECLEYITAPYTQLPKVAEEFQNKIRFPDKGPYEGKYIRITPVAGDFSSSFINASFVNGYRQTKQFIVAQSPMHSTTGDFWALVYEKQSTTILLLCPLQENGKESSVRFWPAEVSHTENFVGYKVTLKGEDVSPSFTTLRLVVQPDAEDLSPLDVTLFHLEDWSAATMPKSGAVLSLLERTRAGQKEGSTSPVVVACNDGLGRSCLFVTLWVLTDQLMMEDQVDVVSAFKAVRASRPGAVDSLDHFIHCYHLLMQYREMHHSMQEE